MGVGKGETDATRRCPNAATPLTLSPRPPSLRQSSMSKFHVFEVCLLFNMTRKYKAICAPYSTAKAVARLAMVQRHARGLPSSSGLCAMGRSVPASSERQSNGGIGKYWFALYALCFLLICLLNPDSFIAASIRGCVTPDILTKLAAIKLETVPGFNTL